MMAEQIGEAETKLLYALGKRGEPEYMFQRLYDAARAEIVAQTRQQALETVYKRMCKACLELGTPTNDNGVWWHEEEPDFACVCAASAIRDLMEHPHEP